MAHFAKLDSNNIVEQVIVVNNDDIKDSTGTETESIGVAFCQKMMGASTNWKKTSYNKNLRGNYAGVGMTYMEGVRTLGVASTDVFIEQQPHPSWSVGINTVQWEAPIPKPQLTEFEKNSKMMYRWNEDNYKNNPSRAWVIGSQ